MALSKRLLLQIAENLEAQHALIASLRDIFPEDTELDSEVLAIVWEYAYGDSASFEGELFCSREITARLLRKTATDA